MEETINKLKEEARQSWNGKIGEERAIHLETFLRETLKAYAMALGLTEKDILLAIEKKETIVL